jgi:integrase
MPNNVIPFAGPGRIRGRLIHEEPTRGKGISRMAQRKRQYGSGCLLQRGKGWAIRWREREIAPDGTTQRMLRYENLGAMSRKEAADILSQRLVKAGKAPVRSRVTFETLANQWLATVVPMYKPSTQKNHRHILSKHLMPRFGDKAIADVTRQEIQAYVAHLTQAGYAPKSIDHMHDVLSAILRTAVKWGHLADNPARGVDLPTLKTVRPKWALTIAQGSALFKQLPLLARTMVGLALLTGLRRGELFALRWQSVNLEDGHLTVEEAVYEGAFGTPKTSAGLRRVPLSEPTVRLLKEWKARAWSTEPPALVFSTWSGKPISSNNVSRRWVFPACAKLKLPNATWLTFRRTYATWAHDQGVPGKVVAQLMGHTNADVTINVYTQVLDASLRTAVDRIGGELFTIVHETETGSELSR